MIAVNLIPSSRRITRRRRSRVGAWLAFNGVLLLVLVVAGGYAQFSSSDPVDEALPEAARQAKERLRVAQDRDKRALQGVRVAQMSLDTAKLSADRPDWSLLLQLIEDQRGSDVMLESIEVSGGMTTEEPAAGGKAPKPVAGKPAPPPLKREMYDVKISGVAESPKAASALVLRLEETGLFSQIQIGETQPRDLEGISMTRFRIDCQVRQKEVAQPQGPRPATQPSTGREGGPFSSLRTEAKEPEGDR